MVNSYSSLAANWSPQLTQLHLISLNYLLFSPQPHPDFYSYTSSSYCDSIIIMELRLEDDSLDCFIWFFWILLAWHSNPCAILFLRLFSRNSWVHLLLRKKKKLYYANLGSNVAQLFLVLLRGPGRRQDQDLLVIRGQFDSIRPGWGSGGAVLLLIYTFFQNYC